MEINHLGLTVRQHDIRNKSLESFCPACGLEVIPRRGNVNVWHWAHKEVEMDCIFSAIDYRNNQESRWHKSMKSIAVSRLGYEAEKHVKIDGRCFRVDAYHSKHKIALEFVNSLNECYLLKRKYFAIAKERGLTSIWIFNGDKFLNRHTPPVERREDIPLAFQGDGSTKHRIVLEGLLSRKCHFYMQELNGIALCHRAGKVFKNWSGSFGWVTEMYFTKRAIQKDRVFEMFNPSGSAQKLPESAYYNLRTLLREYQPKSWGITA